MKKIVLSALLVFSAIGCESDDNKQTNSGSNNTPANIQFSTLGKGDATPSSAIMPRFYVLRSQAEFDAFKTKTNILNGVTVDFAVNEVIVVFDDYKASSGFTIEIKSISQSDSKLTVEIAKTSVEEGEPVFATDTQPFHAVRLQKKGLPVVFNEDDPL